MTWVHLLLPHVELAVVKLPGRGARLVETPYQRMDELVKNIFAALDLAPNHLSFMVIIWALVLQMN